MKFVVTALVMLALMATEAEAARGHKRKGVAAPRAPVTQTVPHRDEGPDLPWPCWVVRMHAKMKGLGPPLTAEKQHKIAQLEKENGITPKQHRQAEACFAKPKAS